MAATPESVRKLVKKGMKVRIERGAGTLAGFPDDQAAQGNTAGDSTLAGLRVAKQQGWTPDDGPGTAEGTQ